MAFIQGQEEELDPNNPQGGQGQAPLVGQGSTQVAGAGGPGGPAGAGGQGGWTNLQAYLSANEGDTGSAGALDRTVGGQFGSERDKMKGDASQFTTDAQKYSADHSLQKGQVDDYTRAATDMYSWGGYQPVGGGGDKPADPFSDQGSTGAQEKATKDADAGNAAGSAGNVDSSLSYEDLVGKMKSGLSDQYGGARDYSYGLSNPSQEYGSQLNDEGGFQQLMNHVYSDAAGRPMTAGQNALQRQLDVNNTGLVDARARQRDNYAQLGKDRDALVADTTKNLGGIEKNYYDNQNAMRDYIGGQANQYSTDISQAEGAARDAYNQEFTGGVANYGDFGSYLKGGLSNEDNGTNAARDNVSYWVEPRDNGMAGLNWQDLQRQLDGSSWIDQDKLRSALEQPLSDSIGHFNNDAYSGLVNQIGGLENQYKGGAKTALDSFYQGQEDKYKDLGNDKKKAYNVLQDFLGLNDKKSQGFNVRS